MSGIAIDNQYMMLSLLEQNILLPIGYVVQIVPNATLSDIPHEAPAYRGTLNYHGRGLDIYDLCTLLNTTARLELSLENPILLVKVQEETIGLLVSAIEGIRSIADDQLQAATSASKPYVTHLFESVEYSAWVIDIEKLIQFDTSKISVEHDHE